MKRFHVHISVDDLAASIEFYSQLFGQKPSLTKEDYAKWMLDDPRINFAISTRGHEAGLNHFGLQADSDSELAVLKQQAEAAMGYEMSVAEADTCCYALSKKYWVTDPSGIPWEHYISMGESKKFNDPDSKSAGCCIPSAPDNTAVQHGSRRGGCC
ncbi:MAG: Glyoxalase/bleomycin resistance/dioxygenase family protein [uncultured Thiotrichaceae bacterium]|uniref:Glyoxalase/bleomycin resistance/dioxygenase family protein n=1 Tax=uncultured Thiotrichaceae bacterium TaxID=298394 RepID=A0A6S6T124_9GAMM|nr:MAG: Glyoxalase/bleomycin resistance/dioxygenase family protein [uncultured Thiotrichaceae bacterium]